MPPVKKPKAKAAKESNKEEATPVVSGQLKKKIQRQQARQKLQRGVVCIRHLPHGFFEDQLRNYFEQFGTVTRLRLARSKLTGNAKGYAYVEFEYPEVAEVAAETMDNYLMFNKVVKASYIPPEKQVYNFFKTSVRPVKNKAGKAIYVSGKTAAIAKRVKKFNENSDENYQKRTLEKLRKIQKLNKKHAHLGIDFNKIVVGSRVVDKEAKKNEEKAGIETETKTADLPTKSGKRKTETIENPLKKPKKEPALEDLLGTTLNDSSDDEDYTATSENDEEETNETLNKSVGLEDLLGATLNDDSDDDEWAAEADYAGNVESAEESDELSDTMDNDNEDEEENSPPQKQQTQKKVSKLKQAKTDNLEKLIKHKKLMGGIQKVSKPLSKKLKVVKAKNAMQAALAKQLAQPTPLLKNKIKASKKQKK